MNVITQTVASRLLVAVVAAAMIFTFATPAKAQTIEDLQAQISALMAQIAALTGSTDAGAGSAACTFTRSLTIGSEGPDVNCLQNYLTGTGHFNFSGGSTGYFGPVTQSAVAAWQGANGVAPAVGYFGPISQAKYNELQAAVPPTTPDEDEDEDDDSSAELEGGEGYLDVETLLDSDVTIDLGDSESVIEVELEAKDSDIEVNRIDFMFDARPWLYFDEVNLFVDGEEVGSLSRSGDFTEVGGDYRARFSGVDTVIREDDTAEVVLELVVLDSMSGTRDTETVQVSLPVDGIRTLDGAGLTDYAPDAAVGPVNVDFDDTFGDGDIDVSISSDSPEALTIILEESSRTTGNEVLVFEVEAEDSDIEVTDVTVLFAEEGNGAGAALYRARLYADGDLLSTKSAATSTIFTDLDYMIDEDDTVEFTVEVDFNRGDTLTLPSTFTVTSVEVDGENADFAAVNQTLTVDEDHTLIMDGIALTGGTVSTAVVTNTTTADDSYGEFRVRFDVQAVGDTMYVPLTALRGASSTIGAAFQIEDSNGTAVPAAGTTTQSLTRVSGGSVSGGYVRINDGQTATFELYVTYNPATAGQYRTQLLTVGFNDSAAATPTDTASAIPAEDFETGNQNITS